MLIFKVFLVVFVGVFVRNVMSIYNPMLTYTLRFKKISIQPNFTGTVSIDQIRSTQYINGQLMINPKQLINKTVVIFYRCDSEGINCEYFQTWTFTDICTKLAEKNQVWSRLYGSFDPPMVCPLDKINYQMKNGTVDISQIIRLYSEATDYQWKVMQKMYSGDVFVGGLYAEISLFGYRKKKKSILQSF